MTLIAFFVLAIMLFLAVGEFKLTTLKGFILVPFVLWRGTSSIAEPVLGQIITSGVRILVFAAVPASVRRSSRRSRRRTRPLNCHCKMR